MNDQKAVRAAIARMVELGEEGKSADFVSEFSRALNLSSASKLWDEGKEAIAIAMAAWSHGMFAHDEIFVLIHHTSAFHSSAGEHVTVIELYIQAANYFSEFEAYQSAYRLLGDAEEYARHHRLTESLPQVWESAASISTLEGDLAFAEKTFLKAQQTRAALGMSVPPRLRANMAMLQMTLKNFEAARDSFQQVLAQETDVETRRCSLLNCSACLRELGQLDDAQLYMAQARSLVDDNTTSEVMVEFDLIEAKTAAMVGDPDALSRCLLNAVIRIDEMLIFAGRLHYRRDLRGRYRARITTLLCELPERGESVALLPVFAFLKANSFSDWMAFLDWYDQVRQSVETPAELRKRLAAIVQKLADAGAPTLYGFREKYDDPWSTSWAVSKSDHASVADAWAVPWSELNNVVHEVVAQTSHTSPWQDATSAVRAAQLSTRLDKADAFFVVLFTERALRLFTIAGGFYARHDFPMEQIRRFHASQAGFLSGNETRDDYMQELDRCVQDLAKGLKGDFDAIANSECGRIMILPEPFDVPLLASVMDHPKLRKRAREGSLAIDLCPVLHPRMAAPFDTATVSACWHQEDGLDLNEQEVRAVSRILSPATIRTFSLPASGTLEAILSASVVHVVAHGIPVSNFRDAFFARSHPADGSLNIPELQSVCWATPHQIAFLNSCFSGDVLNWNYFRDFRTNEQIGLPATLLLNRRAVVIAASWRTFDVTSFIFAILFYTNVVGGLDPGRGFARAMAQLIEMTSDQVQLMLESVQDEELRAHKQHAFAAPGKPFQHPYVSGTFQFISLI